MSGFIYVGNGSPYRGTSGLPIHSNSLPGQIQVNLRTTVNNNSNNPRCNDCGRSFYKMNYDNGNHYCDNCYNRPKCSNCGIASVQMQYNNGKYLCNNCPSTPSYTYTTYNNTTFFGNNSSSSGCRGCGTTSYGLVGGYCYKCLNNNQRKW